MSEERPAGEPDAPGDRTPVANCPECSTPIVVGDSFCEACGAPLGDAAVVDPGGGRGAGTLDEAGGPEASNDGDIAASPPRTTVRLAVPQGSPATCRACGGVIDSDGFCSQCGVRAPSERDHWSEHPSEWVAGVCDRGVVHAANEDALALASTTSSSGAAARAVLVVCDGVTSAPESARASMAAVRAACRFLVEAGVPSGSPAQRLTELHDVLVEATALAQTDVVAVARALGDPPEPPSCTFVAAVVSPDLLVVAWCGDSRAYWLPDGLDGAQVTIDHSIGTELIRAGASRDAAEADPRSHVITRWLGADSVDARPEIASVTLDSPGWVLVCSDGMWNYASTAQALRRLVDEAVANGAEGPLPIADSMVAVANARGGHDNVTVALARVGSLPAPPVTHLPEPGADPPAVP